jgi:hypothetical protein
MKHRRIVKRSDVAAVGAAGGLLIVLAIVVPMAAQAGPRGTGAVTAAYANAPTPTASPTTSASPTPRPITLPKPVTITIKPVKREGEDVWVQYTVKVYPKPKTPLLYTTEFWELRPGWPGGAGLIWTQQFRTSDYPMVRQNLLNPGQWKIITTVEGPNGAVIGQATQNIIVLPPPPPPTPKPTPKATPTATPTTTPAP